MIERKPSAFYALVFILYASISTIGLVADRSQGTLLLLSYLAAFCSYLVLCWLHRDHRSLLYLGIGARLMLFFSMPTLSEDIFRFIWDGRLVLDGIDPYFAPPDSLQSFDPELLQELNSPAYHSVYPPLNQGLFTLSAALGGSSLLFATNLLRGLLLFAEIGSYVLLRKLLIAKGKSPDLANWYFLNPLVILEVVGNVHLEGLVIFFLLSGLCFLQKNNPVHSGVGFGLAIATKLLPLLFLPALFFSMKWKKGFLLCSVAVLVGFLPFLIFPSTSSFTGFQQSLGLYFQKFEFNASVYFLVREFGFWYKGYNIIGTAGPILSLISAGVILGLAIYGSLKKGELSQILLFALFTYLLFSTTVHPWYILPLVVLGILSGFWFPVVWSGFIFLTYLGYKESGYSISLVWIATEYLIVFSVLTYELYRYGKTR